MSELSSKDQFSLVLPCYVICKYSRKRYVAFTHYSHSRGKSVDYTQPDDELLGDFVMRNACGDCQIYIIRRPQQMPSGKTRYNASIWTLSDNGETRLQQKRKIILIRIIEPLVNDS